ncbi:MAG: hypothetical protein Q8N45_00600, partial [Anaerolineales bacterium]|nr:hypothetical protein [Anaerolineales bacterium]
MKHKLVLLLSLLIIASMLLASCGGGQTPSPAAPAATEAPAAAATEAPAAATGECLDANRVPITWSTIAGFYTDAMTDLVAGFEKSHCVKVKVINIDNSQLYDKQIIEA